MDSPWFSKLIDRIVRDKVAASATKRAAANTSHAATTSQRQQPIIRQASSGTATASSSHSNRTVDYGSTSGDVGRPPPPIATNESLAHRKTAHGEQPNPEIATNVDVASDTLVEPQYGGGAQADEERTTRVCAARPSRRQIEGNEEEEEVIGESDSRVSDEMEAESDDMVGSDDELDLSSEHMEQTNHVAQADAPPVYDATTEYRYPSLDLEACANAASSPVFGGAEPSRLDDGASSYELLARGDVLSQSTFPQSDVAVQGPGVGTSWHPTTTDAFRFAAQDDAAVEQRPIATGISVPVDESKIPSSSRPPPTDRPITRSLTIVWRHHGADGQERGDESGSDSGGGDKIHDQSDKDDNASSSSSDDDGDKGDVANDQRPDDNGASFADSSPANEIASTGLVSQIAVPTRNGTPPVPIQRRQPRRAAILARTWITEKTATKTRVGQQQQAKRQSTAAELPPSERKFKRTSTPIASHVGAPTRTSLQRNATTNGGRRRRATLPRNFFTHHSSARASFSITHPATVGVTSEKRQSQSASTGIGPPTASRRQRAVGERSVSARGHGRLFECEECGKRYSRKSHLNDHLRIHANKRPYKCDVCGADFTRSNVLQAHVRSHTNERPYQCDECYKTFAQSAHRVQHKARVHAGARLNQFECEVCGKRFSTKGHLSVHQWMHTGNRPYKCRMCSAAFTRSDLLKRHTRTHTGERPFECEVCAKTFAQSGHLAYHRTIHAGAVDLPEPACAVM